MRRPYVLTVLLGQIVFSLLGGRLIGLAAESEPSHTASVDRERLLYDGKSFVEWKNELATELKPERRAEAIKAFAAFGANGWGKEAAAVVIDAVRKPDGEPASFRFTSAGRRLIRAAAINAFKMIDPSVGVPALVRELEQGSPSDRYFALDALQSIPMLSEPAVPVLLDLVRNDEEAGIRYRAFSAIRAIGWQSQEFLSALRTIIRDQEAENITSAIDSVRSTDRGSSQSGTIFERKGSRLSADRQRELAARTSANPQLFSRVATYLGRILRPEARQILHVLIEAIGDDNRDTRLSVIRALPEFGPAARDAVGPLMRAFEKADRDERLAILDTLEVFGPDADEAVSMVCKLITEKDEEIRKRSLFVLGGIGPGAKDAVQPLIQAFEKGGNEDRRAIADVLGYIGPAAADAIPTLANAMGDDNALNTKIAQTIQKIKQDRPKPAGKEGPWWATP
jgi:HEAT repeat protein